MRKTALFLIIFIASLGWDECSAQFMTEKMDRNQFVFWFYVRAEIKTNRKTKKPGYVVRTYSKTPKSGNIMKFEKDLYRSLKGGQNLVIGPFLEFEDAIRSITMYDLATHTDESMAKEIAEYPDSIGRNECYWFNLRYEISKRKHCYILKRTPARVAPGNVIQFKEFLWDALQQRILAIGPFTSQQEAEESKRLYRLEEIDD